MSRYIVERDPRSVDTFYLVINQDTGEEVGGSTSLDYSLYMARELARRDVGHKTWFDHY